MKAHIEKLRKLKVCSGAIEFAAKFTNIQKMWDACERGDWMLEIIDKVCGEPESKSRKKLILVVCKCARLSLKYVPKNEKRPIRAIQAAEKWAKGNKDIFLQDIKVAADAAVDSSDLTYVTYAKTNAAYAAAYAAVNAAHTVTKANSVNAASYVAYATAHAVAYAATATADAATCVAVKRNVLKKCANIVHKYYSKAPRI